MPKNKKPTPTTTTETLDENSINIDELAGLTNRINDLEAQLDAAGEQARRAQADYQNLLRRIQAEKVEFIKFSNQDLVTQLIEPLRNLSLAAQALNDQGLNMVIDQFWSVLHDLGVKQIGSEIVGQEFNVETMEAIERKGEGNQVLTVVAPGYILNDKVIEHAKVMVG